MEFDLDQAVAAARAEMGEEERTVRFRGQSWELALDVPYDFLRHTDDECIDLLFGARAEEFRACKPTVLELRQLMLMVLPRFYGFGSLGESSASSGTSANGSRPSRRTSKRTTGST